MLCYVVDGCVCRKLKMMKKQRANSGPGGNGIPDGNDTQESIVGGGGNSVYHCAMLCCGWLCV